MPSTGNRSAKLSWQAAVPMVTSPFFLWDLAKVFAITALILALILSLIQLASPAPGFWRACWLIPLLVCSGLYALTLLISLIVFFNRYWVQFTLDEDGVLYESVRWSRKVSGAINAGAVVLGLLAAMPAAAGAGLMARSRQTVFLPWERVRKVRCFDRFRVITLSNSWRPVLRLHCPTDELYAQAQEKIWMAVPTME